MKTLKVTPGIGFALFLVLFFFSACEPSAVFNEIFLSINGQVVDVKASSGTTLAPLASVIMTLKDRYGYVVDTTSTASDGTFHFGSLDPDAGPFELTGSSIGYLIVGQTVEFNGLALDLGVVPAFQLSQLDADNYAISYILTWDKYSGGLEYDLDLHLSFNITYAAPSSFALNDPYPSDAATDRARVFYGAPVYPAAGTPIDIFFATEDSSVFNLNSGVETITLRNIPNADPGSYPITGGDAAAILGSGYNYAWMGHADAYINLYDSSLNRMLSDCNPVLYVIQSYLDGGAPAAVLIGKFTLPDMAVNKSAKMVRTDMFYDNTGTQCFIISWDGQLLTAPNAESGTTFLSVVSQNYVGLHR